MIVCLGWGSLIWDPRELPLAGDWQDDGPELPVEFVRQSKDGRLTLVIDPSSPAQRVLWAPLSVASLEEATKALWKREETDTVRPIGRWPKSRPPHVFSKEVAEWCRANGFEGVVWTALGAKFQGDQGRRPSQAEALDYLASLSGAARARAEEYVRKAPVQIETPYRRAFAENLGWDATNALQ